MSECRLHRQCICFLVGLEYTGAPMNPILGFASGWGCRDHWFPSHLFVYWLGPFLGISIGDWVVENFMDVDNGKTLMTSAGEHREQNGTVLEENGNHEKIQWRFKYIICFLLYYLYVPLEILLSKIFFVSFPFFMLLSNSITNKKLLAIHSSQSFFSWFK